MAPNLTSLLNASVLSYFAPETGEEKAAPEKKKSGSVPEDGATKTTPESVDISPIKSEYFSYFLDELILLQNPNELGSRQSLFGDYKVNGVRVESGRLSHLLEGSDLKLQTNYTKDREVESFSIGTDCHQEITEQGNEITKCNKSYPIPHFVKAAKNHASGDTNGDGKLDLAEAQAVIDKSPGLQEKGTTPELLLKRTARLVAERYEPIDKKFKDHILTIPWYSTFEAVKLASAGVTFAELRDASSSLHPNNMAKWIPNGANMGLALFIKPFLAMGGWGSDTIAEFNDSIPWAYMDNKLSQWAIEEKHRRNIAIEHFADAVDDAIVSYIDGDQSFAWVAAMDWENLKDKEDGEKQEARLEALQGALDYMASEQFAMRIKEKKPDIYGETPLGDFAESAQVLQEQLPIFELHNIVTQDNPEKVAEDLLTFAEEEFPFAFGMGGGHMPEWNWRRLGGQLNNTTLAEAIINAVRTQQWSDNPEKQEALRERAEKLYEDLKGKEGDFFEWSEDDELHLPGYALSYAVMGWPMWKAVEIPSDIRKYSHSLSVHAIDHLLVNYAKQGLLESRLTVRWAPMRGSGASGFVRGGMNNLFLKLPVNVLKIGVNVITGGLGQGIGSQATHEAIMAYNRAPGGWRYSLDRFRHFYRIPLAAPSYLVSGALKLIRPITSRLSNLGKKADEVSDAAGAAKAKTGLQKTGQALQTTQHGILRVMAAASGPLSIHSFFTENKFTFSFDLFSSEGIKEFLLPDELGEDATKDERVRAAFVKSFDMYDRAGNYYPEGYDSKVGLQRVDLRRVPDPRQLDAAYQDVVEEEAKVKKAPQDQEVETEQKEAAQEDEDGIW